MCCLHLSLLRRVPASEVSSKGFATLAAIFAPGIGDTPEIEHRYQGWPYFEGRVWVSRLVFGSVPVVFKSPENHGVQIPSEGELCENWMFNCSFHSARHRQNICARV